MPNQTEICKVIFERVKKPGDHENLLKAHLYMRPPGQPPWGHWGLWPHWRVLEPDPSGIWQLCLGRYGTQGSNSMLVCFVAEEVGAIARWSQQHREARGKRPTPLPDTAVRLRKAGNGYAWNDVAPHELFTAAASDRYVAYHEAMASTPTSVALRR